MSLEEIVRKASGGMFNNAAQVWNHTFYWNCLAPKGGGEPSGTLADAIDKAFGSFDALQEGVHEDRGRQFGSGWAWLVKNADRARPRSATSNAETPFTGARPAAADLRRLGARVLHRLPQRAAEVRRGVLEARELGFHRQPDGLTAVLVDR